MHYLELIYALYPRKVGKRTALKAISYALTRIHDGELGQPMAWDDAAKYLGRMTREFSDSPAGQRGPFTPHPSTWFNRSSYMDDPKEWNYDAQQPSKTQQRVSNNRSAIIEGLYGKNAGPGSEDGELRDDASGTFNLGKRALKATSGSD